MAQIRDLKKRLDAGSFAGLKFYKTPTDIVAQCTKEITELENDIAETREKAEEICKRHELSFSEVFEEEISRLSGQDPYANVGQEAAYMTKITANIAAHQIIAYQDEIENFRRIVNHIEAYTTGDKTFELTYAELVELGFE